MLGFLTIQRETGSVKSTIDADGENLATVPARPGHDNTFPAWSLDGSTLAVSSSGVSDNGDDIFVMRADGRKVEQLTRDPVLEHSPDWRKVP